MIKETPKAGDILLVRVPFIKKATFLHYLIGLAQKPVERYGEVMTYTHAALFTGSGMQIIEAAAKGVQYGFAQADHRDNELWRPVGLTEEQRQVAVKAAATKIGNVYGWLDLISGGHIRTKADVCSEVVVGALRTAGVDLGAAWAPNHLARSPKLERIV